MRKFWAFTLLILAGCGLILPAGRAAAQDTQNFTVTSFDAQYFLHRNTQKTSVMNVIETINAKFPDFDQNHGILRAIPKSYQGHTVSLSIESVKNAQGTAWKYTTSTDHDNTVLKIGDADVFVHGPQTYVIRYTVRNVINFQPDHQELYWDVNGDQWPQSFGRVSATVQIDKNVADQLQDRQVCYAGSPGSANQSGCSINRESSGADTDIKTQTTRELGAYQTLTFVLAFNQGTFEQGPEITREKRVRTAEIIAAVTAAAVPPLIAFGFMFRRWRQFGNDPKGRGVIIPEYEPPKGLNTLTADFVLQEKLRNAAITAAVIEMAIGRYLTLYEVVLKKRLRPDSKDFTIKITKETKDLPADLQMVINLIFGSDAALGSQTSISQIKIEAKTKATLYNKMKDLEKWLAEELYKTGYFIKNPRKIRTGYWAWAGGLFGFATLLFFTVYVIPLGVGLILAAAVIAAYSFVMPARTEKGVEANDALLGLKDYIKLAEADRLKFGQSAEGAEKIAEGSFDPTNPKMKVKLFETLLPYAILFGLEKSWAKQFADIYKQPPDWYQGHWAAFNTGYLVGSINSFQAASAQTFTPPSSSSGSGFSGGGGAGGGGGGGGGGGW
ncbi:MAG TPA: DUF2207 domain-containing protein [Candidatus Saccharimonadales bacterium]|nr:DUF2207 domain-containing protein [Candidatus Saccharimonadales bacterium]